MHGDAGVGREKTKAQPRLRRGRLSASTQSPTLTGLDQSPVATRDHFLAFLTGSASHSKLAATPRKKRMAPSLPGSRIAHLRIWYRRTFSPILPPYEPSRPSEVVLLWTVARSLIGQPSLARWITQTEL